MASHQLFEIGDSAVRLTPNGSHSGLDITIQNQGPDSLFLGVDNTLDQNNFGYKVESGQAFSVELPGHEALYAFSSNGAIASVLSVSLEQGA